MPPVLNIVVPVNPDGQLWPPVSGLFEPVELPEAAQYHPPNSAYLTPLAVTRPGVSTAPSVDTFTEYVPAVELVDKTISPPTLRNVDEDVNVLAPLIVSVEASSTQPEHASEIPDR